MNVDAGEAREQGVAHRAGGGPNAAAYGELIPREAETGLCQHTRGSAITWVALPRDFDAQLVLAVGAMCPKFEKAIVARGLVGSLTGVGQDFFQQCRC